MQDTATQKELAELIGYTPRRIRDINAALAEDKKFFVTCEDGKYDVKIFVKRWIDYVLYQALDGVSDLDAVKAEHEIVKKEKTEIEVAKMKGDLVDAQEVMRLWGSIANTVMQNMLHLPTKLAPMVIGLTNQNVIAEIMEKEIRIVLEAIADTPVEEESEE